MIILKNIICMRVLRKKSKSYHPSAANSCTKWYHANERFCWAVNDCILVMLTQPCLLVIQEPEKWCFLAFLKDISRSGEANYEVDWSCNAVCVGNILMKIFPCVEECRVNLQNDPVKEPVIFDDWTWPALLNILTSLPLVLSLLFQMYFHSWLITPFKR